MYNKSLKELSASLHRKEISSVELSHYFLDRIARFDGELNSVITINTDAALKAAEQADKLIAS
ncbi:MAG TPA: Asp-tRNA(Asn)/Glu-tRNA(Gln) amidotransferase GatCAB subunit A, partial [Methylococcaceae bacterium]|nr:Asp-tRNA(Asn)/Glu-tRNA(Gln) amidotransferase GatCAB subunit A [Methylococcaceae bacterium]